MTCYQRAHGRNRLLRTLRLLGGELIRVYRTERDGNGMPLGSTAQVCTLYGVRYRQHAAPALTLDMPGTIAGRRDMPRIIAVLREGSVPQAGDQLEDGTGILDVEENLGALCLGLGGEPR